MQPDEQPATTHVPARRVGWRRLLLAGLLLVLLAGVPLGWRWYVSSEAYQMRLLNEARERWETRPFDRYRLRVWLGRFPPRQGGVVIVSEFADEAAINAGPYITRQYAVSSFFDLIEEYPRREAFRCAGLNFECTRPLSYNAQVFYDEQLGYPRQIDITRTRHPDWFNLAFWRWLVASGGWQQCENLLCHTTETRSIMLELTPLEEAE